MLGEVDVDRALYEKIGDDVKVSAPGMKYRHYAPKAPVTVVRGDPQDTAKYIAEHIGNATGVLCFDEYRDMFPHLRGRVLRFAGTISVHRRARYSTACGRSMIPR